MCVDDYSCLVRRADEIGCLFVKELDRVLLPICASVEIGSFSEAIGGAHGEFLVKPPVAEFSVSS